MKKVVVGLSGGVDSSVAAWLLKDAGYDVHAIYMKNWHDTTGLLHGDCPANDDITFAQLVARKLDIPFEVVDLSVQYKQRVVDYMFAEYAAGRTPNPDVLCNREVKFDIFLKVALEKGADYVATGHYAQKSEVNGEYCIIAGADTNKDQSYFLCQLSQEQLKFALFPIGHMVKGEVRKIAADLGLATAERKDSQGICFVGKVDLPTFLQQQLQAKDGFIFEIPEVYYNFHKRGDSLEAMAKPYFYKPEDGIVVGKHRGAHFYTIGQRKGLNVGGKAKPLFVIAIDVNTNSVYTGQSDEHPGLYRKALFIKNTETHWVRPSLFLQPGETREYMVRIRYRQPLQKAILRQFAEGLFIEFDESQRGITAGQFAAWYFNGELCGSGVINE